MFIGVPWANRITRRTALKAGAAVAPAGLSPRAPIRRNPKRPVIEGYTDQLSYAPGDEVKLHVSSSTGTFDFKIVRSGRSRERSPAPNQSAPVPTRFRRTPRRTAAAGRSRSRSTSPTTWTSGYYEVATDRAPAGTASRRLRTLFFVVRPKEPGKDTKILLQLATNTYNAYTNWGGYSLYAYNGRHKVQGRRVSFDRPHRRRSSRNWELPFVAVGREERLRARLLPSTPTWNSARSCSKHYKLVLSVGHDEYWSAPMRDHLEKFIADGGNVAFFSGNTCCWQVRSEDNGRALACWKQSFGDDPLLRERRPQAAHARCGATTSSAGRRTRSPASASCGAATTAATGSSWTAPGRSPSTGPTTGCSRART